MLIIFLVLILSMLFSMKVSLIKNDKEYMSVENTQAIKGIFIIFVFLSHIRSYIVLNSMPDRLIIKGVDYLGQLMVAMFLFYSGYGIYESIKKKGKTYIDALPKNRIAKIYTQFVWAVFIFLLLNILLGIKYPIKEIALAFTGWTSIGNSNWYMFAIFMLYFITYVSFKVFNKSFCLAFITLVLLSCAYIVLIQRYQGGWWCDTFLCFAFGVLYSYFKDKIDKIFGMIGCVGYFTFLAMLIFIYCIGDRYRFVNINTHNLYAILFCVVVVTLSMKISFKSKILIWCGKNLFWVYILQRIPMILFKHFRIDSCGGNVYISLCAIVTVVMAIYVPLLIEKISSLNMLKK